MYKLPPRKTLAEEGSKPYLERTKDRHNGVGYKEVLADMRAKVSVAASARKAGVTHKTMKGWQQLIRDEITTQTEQTAAVNNEFN